MPTRFKVAGVAAVATLALLIGGVSSALFTDTHRAGAYAQTGKVNISVSEKITVGNVLPGVPRSTTVEFDNTGSTAPVAMSLSGVSHANVSNPNGCDLGLLKVSLVNAAGDTVWGPKAFATLQPSNLHIRVNEGQKWTGKAVFTLPESAGNSCQSMAVHYAALDFTGTQIVP